MNLPLNIKKPSKTGSRSPLGIAAFAVAAMLFFCASSFADEAEDRKRLEALKKSIAALKSELESTKSNRDELLKSLEETEESIGELSKKAEKLQQELKQGQEKLEDLRDERSQLNESKKTQQAHVSQHINAAYRLGQQSSIRLLLNQQDPSAVSRNLKYFDFVIKSRTKKISGYVNTINRLNEIEPQIAAETSRIEQNYSRLRGQRDALRQQNQHRQLTVAKLDKTIASKDEELKTMNRDRRRLQNILAEVSRFLDDIKLPAGSSSFASLKGKLPWPTEGRVIRNYGTSRISNRLNWEGILIEANPGAPVRAVHHGRIVFSDYLRGHGLLIIIDHGAGFMTLYAHNQALYKEIGEWVDAGESIASVGNSGGRQDSALYFELRHNGQPANPRGWFRAA